EDGIRDFHVTGVQTCALPISHQDCLLEKITKMKTILFLLISTLLAAVSCESQADQNSETWWINSAKMDCVGVSPMSCLQIQKGRSEERRVGKECRARWAGYK